MVDVYIVTHRISGKSYVGCSNNVARRFADHKKCLLDTCFSRALRKYGPEAFDWSVVETYETRQEALEAEVFMIAYLRSIGVELYNMTEGGEGGLPWNETFSWKGKSFSNEHKAKLSEKAKVRLSDPTERAKNLELIEKLAKDPTVNQKRSSSLKGRKFSQEHLENIRSSQKARRAREKASV